MTTNVETFDRADSTSLGSDWAVSAGAQLQIQSNAAIMTASSSTFFALYLKPADTNDTFNRILVKASVSAFAILTRATANGAASSYYGMRRVSSTQVSLIKKESADASWSTIIGPITVEADRAPVAGAIMEVRAVGTLISGFINGFKVVEATDTTIPTGKLAGWRQTATGAGNSFDTMESGDYIYTPPVSEVDKTPPGAITDPVVSSNSATSQTITFTKPTDVDLSAIQVYVNGDPFGDPIQGSPFVATPLLPSTSYTWTFRAYDTSGNYATSGASVTQTTLAASDTSGPSAPSGVTIGAVTPNSIAVSWTGSTAGGSAILGYQVLANGSDAFSEPVVASVRSDVLEGLTPDTNYVVTVGVADASQRTAYSAGITVRTAKVTSGAGTGASFTDSFDYSDGPIDSAIWGVSTANQLVAVSGKARVATTSTVFRAMFQRSVGQSDMISKFKLDTIVSTFLLMTRATSDGSTGYALRRKSSTQVTIATVINSDVTELGGVGYTFNSGDEIELRAVGNVISGWVNGVKIVEVTNSSITTGSYGGFRFSGNNQGFVFDEFSVAAYSPGDDKIGPSKVSPRISNLTSSGMLVTWDEATDNVSVAGYYVYANGTRVGTVGPAARSYQVTGLVSAKDYQIVVAAFDAATNETKSEPVPVRTFGNTSGNIPNDWLGSGQPVPYDNVTFGAWSPDTQKEVGFFYGGRAAAYWDGKSVMQFSLPEGRPVITRWLGKTLVMYGDSSNVVQTTAGVDYVTADLWGNRVAAGWTDGNVANGPSSADYPSGLALTTSSNSSYANRHSGSHTGADVTVRMLNAGSQQYIAGSHKLMTVFFGGNDVGSQCRHPNAEAAYKNGWRSAISIARHASRVTASTDSAGWSAHSTLFSGNAKVSTTPGATRVFQAAGDEMSVMLIASTSGAGSAYSVKVDGVTKTGTTRNQAAPTLLGGANLPVAVNFRGLGSGTHTVTVTHTGTAGDTLIVDAVLPWFASESSMPNFLGFPVAYSTPTGWNNYAMSSPRPTNADADQYRIWQQEVFREFDFANNVFLCLADMMDVRFPPTRLELRINDGLHPNKLGHLIFASAVLEMIRLLVPVA